MKDAYSNLLGEFVEARDVDNQDVAGFQIVCPCCRDAIFKVCRETDSATIDFFSHYKAPKDFTVAECERRVKGMTSEEISRINASGKAQTLEAFRRVLRQAVSAIPVSGKLIGEEVVTKNLALYQEVAAFMEFVINTAHEQGMLYGFVANSDKIINAYGYENLSVFGASFRNRTAVDLVRTLFASSNAKNILYMVARGVNTAYEPDYQKGKTVLKAKGRAAKLLEAGMVGSDFGDLDAETAARLLMANLSLDAMIREIQRLPFLKMIENAKAGKPPLMNLTIEDYLPDLEDVHRLEFEGNPVAWPGI